MNAQGSASVMWSRAGGGGMAAMFNSGRVFIYMTAPGPSDNGYLDGSWFCFVF